MERENNKDELIGRMIADQKLRREIVGRSHLWFFYYYFARYVEYRMAPFHEQMFALTENTNIKSVVLVSFRNSGKSSIFTLSFPIWAILGVQQIKHVLILSSTRQKVQLLLQNIKKEFETNRSLQGDLGPFKEETNEWNTTSLHLSKYDAKISVASVEQSIRGIRFMQHRPQIILIDDIEDLESVKTKESRDKIDEWLMGEVIPAGDVGTRMIIVGNLLHNDSVIKRLQKRIEEKTMNGVYLEFPIIDKDGNPAWPGKYSTLEAVYSEKQKGLSEITWRREYMLEIVPEEDQIVKESDFHFYDSLPAQHSRDYRGAITSVDLAIKQKETSDFTAILSAQIYGYGNERKIYILPNPINRKMNSLNSADCVADVSRQLGNGMPTRVIVEDVGFQGAFVDLLKEKEIPAEGVPIAGHDKTSRLMIAANLIQGGQILFPQRGWDLLKTQLLGFGVEKHDDLVDALTLIALKLIKEDSGGRIMIPKTLYNPQDQAIKVSPTEEMDRKIVNENNFKRSGYDPALALKVRLDEAKERYKKAAENEQRDQFNKIMRKDMRGY